MISREKFIEAINAINVVFIDDDLRAERLGIAFGMDKNNFFDDIPLFETLVDVLSEDLQDHSDMIYFYCLDLNFGKNSAIQKVLNGEGEEVELKDPGVLYDFLVSSL